MNKVYKWFEDNIYYSVNSGKASIYLENDDLFEFENMLKELVTNYTNLQSKIDKANEILDKLEMQPAYLDCKYYELGGFDELRNALKEDK